MELVFHKENGLYITEFEVTSDFNVHLERSKGGKVSFYQKTTDGNYDHIEKLSKNIDKVFDYDFQALVYPKIIKITSECEFDVSSLTTDGEVTEIKSQSKEVEITSNGVTEIAPDAGFGYLSGVKVNVNVPQSGGSSGDAPSQPSGGWNLAYYKIDHNNSNAAMMIEVVMFYASPHLVNVAYESSTGKLLINGGVGAATLVLDKIDNVKAFVVTDLKVCSGDECEMLVFTDTLNGLKDSMGTPIDMSVFIPITEEEYYNPATFA